MSDDLRATAIERAAEAMVWHRWPGEKIQPGDRAQAERAVDAVLALLAPAPASEPLGPAAEVSPSPKAAQSPASETARTSSQVAGEYMRRFGWADAPAPTPPTTVQADRDATYQPCSHECNGCPTCDPGLAQTDRGAGQVRLTAIIEDDGWENVEVAVLMERAVEAVAWGLLEATSDTTDRPPSAQVFSEAKATAERILAARQSDPDATEREALAKAWDRGAYDGARFQKALHEYANPLHVGTHPEPVPNPYRRTVTTGEWEPVEDATGAGE